MAGQAISMLCLSELLWAILRLTIGSRISSVEVISGVTLCSSISLKLLLNNNNVSGMELYVYVATGSENPRVGGSNPPPGTI